MTATSERTRALPGDWTKLGATVDREGTTFAVWVPEASGVQVCLLDEDGGEERIDLVDQRNQV
jgi:glycogen operon protein